jgi:hypothetical protein
LNSIQTRDLIKKGLRHHSYYYLKKLTKSKPETLLRRD